MKLILIFVFMLISARLNQLHPYSTLSHLSFQINGSGHSGHQSITSPVTSSLSWLAPWPYPFESLIMGLIIFLMSYYRVKRNKELLYHEKLNIALNMVHRTQTPLTLIHNLLHDINSSNLPPDISKKINYLLGYNKHVIDCFQNISTLNVLVNKSKAHLQTNELELYTYIGSVLRHCRIYADTRQIQLDINREPGYISCRVNEVMMTAALQCLLHRIIDATVRKGYICIKVIHAGDRWELQITNSPGSGSIQSWLRQYVLARMPILCCRTFHIVKKIIQIHGGEMTGGISRKSVLIKICVPVEHLCRTEDCPIAQESTLNGHNSTFPCNSHLPPGVRCASKPDKKPHVMLVMADKELSGYLDETLSKNFQVSVYDDPEQFCSIMGQCKPDAVIIDETVNGVYGSEICSEIKRDACMCHIPVVLLISSNDDYVGHTRCGADRIELRMVNVCRLKADIASLISHRIAQKERIKEFAASTLPGDHSEKVAQGDSDAILVDKIQKCLEKNLSTEKYTIEMLCADIGMSRTAFYNRVRFIAGQSPTNYILSYKMGIAKTMLASRRYSVVEIATLLGYCDGKYFSKKFKDFYGVSPMQYVKDAMG